MKKKAADTCHTVAKLPLPLSAGMSAFHLRHWPVAALGLLKGGGKGVRKLHWRGRHGRAPGGFATYTVSSQKDHRRPAGKGGEERR